jgi:hypothetical protein
MCCQVSSISWLLPFAGRSLFVAGNVTGHLFAGTGESARRLASSGEHLFLLLMARVTRGSLLQGISGKIGGIVVRQVGNQTIVSAAEAKGERAPRSARQQAHLDRFFAAQCYAGAQMQDPATKALYATGINERLTSARVVAIADFMNPPTVVAAEWSGYQGRAGDVIRVVATDDFAVTALTVRLETAAEDLLEEGLATLLPDGAWAYTVVRPHTAGPGTRILVQAYDRPGNVGSRLYQL